MNSSMLFFQCKQKGENKLSNTESMGKSLSEIINIRKGKIDKLREMGVNPFPYEYNRTHFTKDVFETYTEIKEKDIVRMAGRLTAIRQMGKANFCDIQDSKGKIQVFFQQKKLGEEQYQVFKLLDIGDIIGVAGIVTETKTKQITVFVEELTILSKSIRPLPIVKEKDGKVYDAFTDKEQRYRQRYLDLIVNPESRKVFETRSKLVHWIRTYLNDNGYMEVETPVLQNLYGGASARPFKTHYNALDSEFFLRVSDELYLKRCIIGGFDKVYEMSKNFRNEGMDRNHNPEFTLLEFYETFVDYNYMMDFVENLFKTLCEKIGEYQFSYEGQTIDFEKPFVRKTMFQLLEEYVGVDLSNADDAEMKKVCEEKGIKISDSDHYGNYIEYLFDRFVEPNLIQPTYVMDFPKAISPLAKLKRDGSDKIVERFELFIGAKEFANAFSELNDPIDQEERLKNQERLGLEGDEEAQTYDKDFIQAMEFGMPPTGGVGIGIDRLTMLFTNQKTIRDVLLFPQMKS